MPGTAIVLLNLGAPDTLRNVRPFLLNMFRDRAILGMPIVLRWPLAWLIASLRVGKARKIYAQLGGGSPLLANTEAQANALSKELGPEFATFVTMRYWHPRSDVTAEAVKRFRPERIVLVPLYPQYSTATSESSIQDWQAAARRAGLNVDTGIVCCYPAQRGWIDALCRLVAERYEAASAHGKPRVLFSAHGLPKSVVDRGDPYQWQVERTAGAVVYSLAIKNLDWSICYQSRVGPLEWIGPSTESEIERAGRDRVPLVVVPIAFVSEHSETLVELDVEYARRAEACGVPRYERVPTVSTSSMFIEGLATIVRDVAKRKAGVYSAGDARICPAEWKQCPCSANSPSAQA